MYPTLYSMGTEGASVPVRGHPADVHGFAWESLWSDLFVSPLFKILADVVFRAENRNIDCYVINIFMNN